jgi:hypothetical protein
MRAKRHASGSLGSPAVRGNVAVTRQPFWKIAHGAAGRPIWSWDPMAEQSRPVNACDEHASCAFPLKELFQCAHLDRHRGYDIAAASFMCDVPLSYF